MKKIESMLIDTQALDEYTTTHISTTLNPLLRLNFGIHSECCRRVEQFRIFPNFFAFVLYSMH